MDKKEVWPDGTSPETVYQHYGYDPESGHHCTRGFWPREQLTERLSELPDFVKLEGLTKKKFRIVIDYDPEFPRALAQTFYEREPEPKRRELMPPDFPARARENAVKKNQTPHGGRTARMFGTEQKPQRNFHDDEGPYKGFLMVKCEECGAVKAFCAKRETYGFKCDECGAQTPLEKLRPMFMRCKCGKEFRYKTNLTDKRVTHTCISCHAPVDMELNRRETAYVTIEERG